MELQMRQSTEGAQDLGEFDDVIETGFMGACVSVIIGWTPNDAGEMDNMRGFHGAGGIGGVNFRALLRDVPNHESTKVWTMSGADNNTLYSIEANRTTILREVRTRVGNAVIQIRSIHDARNARVFRNGNVVRL
jgi:hypothetical protein